jgi:hypothetical protein
MYSSVLNIKYARFEILVSSLVSIKKVVDIFVNKVYYQESYTLFYILIIFLYSSVITVAVWLNNNFQTLKQILINQAGVRYPEVPKYLKHVYKHKMVKC